MAVQAQHPSHILLTDCEKRLKKRSYDLFLQHQNAACQDLQREGAPSLFDQLPNNLNRPSSTVVDTMASHPDVAKLNMSPVLLGVSPISRKHPYETGAAQMGHEIVLPPFQYPHQSSPDGHFEGLRTMKPGFQETVDCGPIVSIPSASGRFMPAPCTMCSESVLQHVLKQEEETKEVITAYGEQIKYIAEESMRIHTMSLIGTIQNALLKKMKEKESEIEKATFRNIELVEQVKQLMLECQLWQSMAHSSELMVISLRKNLEQVVARSRERDCGEGLANEDAESCNIGTQSENQDSRNCRVCRRIEASVLLLPCRHLCLCRDCDAKQASCPICSALKNVSVHVHVE